MEIVKLIGLILLGIYVAGVLLVGGALLAKRQQVKVALDGAATWKAVVGLSLVTLGWPITLVYALR